MFTRRQYRSLPGHGGTITGRGLRILRPPGRFAPDPVVSAAAAVDPSARQVAVRMFCKAKSTFHFMESSNPGRTTPQRPGGTPEGS
ncbi:protein of unknown function [Streptantibioticus cattleyicolor NRRL 8057 = DSM 46488]|nr:protein of unknown function [Streptantibioticus cattleyicolor NRRL 8057 = DSM 46488]